MARYSPNFGDNWQSLLEMGKECHFPSNFDMPRQFTTRKTELQPIKSPNGLLYPRLEVEQQIHSEDEIDTENRIICIELNFIMK